MRADQILMLGVVGVGGYAVYRLLTAPRTLPSGPDAPILDPSLPETPGIVVPPPGSTALMGPRLPMVQHRWYGGRIEDGSALRSREALISFLERMGFGGSTVRPDAPEAEGTSPRPEVLLTTAEAAGRVPGYALTGPGRGTRWFVARWAAPTQTIARPPTLSTIWSTLAPGPR